MSYLSGLLRAGHIQLQLLGRDQEGVLRELVGVVPELKREPQQQQTFVQALLARERLHTTAVGDGVALPHARMPVPLLSRPLLVFGRHVPGIPYAALDKKPVQLFFLLAAPNLTEHLAMLAALSRALRDATLRTALLQRKPPPEILQALEEAERKLGK